MRLEITHRTEYSFDAPLPYALQRLRLVPLSGATQTVRSWALAIEGAREEVRFADHFGNDTRLIGVEGEPHAISIEASGEVETVNKSGVTGFHRGFAPLWLFLRETAMTASGEAVEALAASIRPGADIGRLHDLMAAVNERVPDPADVVASAAGSAADVLAGAGGDCIGQAHVFIAAARRLGFPARFVSGYRMVDGGAGQAASHAWAEAHVEALGWVGFDVGNCISPDENYVRVAIGRDHRDAMPISGIPSGQAAERVAVRVTVEQ